MSTVLEQTYTPEELLATPDRKRYELGDGHLVERQTSVLSDWVAGQVHFLFNGFLRQHDLGWVWVADQGYVCLPASSGKVRFPDVSFVYKSRLPDGLTSDGYIYAAPDLAVEVVSPNDSAYEVQRKVLENLDAGIKLVWVIDPDVRTVLIDRRDNSTSLLRDDAELSGEDVLPGFQCRLSEIFPAKTAEKPATG